MKIAFLDNLSDGGAKRVVFEQVKYFAQEHEVWYGTNNLGSQWNFEALPITYKQFNLSIGRYHGFGRIFQEWELGYKLKNLFQSVSKALESWQPEAVIVHPCRYTQAPWVLSLTSLKTLYFAEEWLRILYEPENFPLPKKSWSNKAYEYWQRRYIGLIDKKNLGLAKKVITTSEFNAGQIKQAYKRIPEVVPLGVDTEIFRPNQIKPNKGYFLFLGEPDEWHGYNLINEAEKLNQYRFRVKMVKKRHGNFSLSEKELVQTYQGAMAVLCLDKKEPFGLIPLEAMACGVPVIAVNEGGYRETVTDNQTGFLIERKPLALYEAMKLIAEDQRLRQRLGENGRLRAEKHFTWTKHNRRLERLIRQTK